MERPCPANREAGGQATKASPAIKKRVERKSKTPLELAAKDLKRTLEVQPLELDGAAKIQPAGALAVSQKTEGPSKAGHFIPPHRKYAARSKACGLLTLPGELRNKIYAYVYDTERTVIIRPNSSLFDGHPLSPNFIGKPTAIKAQKILTIKSTLSPRPCQTLQSFRKPGGKPRPREQIKWASSPIGLLLTCKEIENEAGDYLYSNCTFFFESASYINAFIKTTKSRNLQHVRNMKVLVQVYGIPQLTSHTHWEQRHLDRWTDTFAAMSVYMPNIQHLDFNLHLPDLSGVLSRAFRACREKEVLQDWIRDVGPLLTIIPLSNLQHLQKIKVHTTSSLLTVSRDAGLVAEVYGPHFEVHGMYQPTTQQQDIVFQFARMQIEDLHGALNRSLKKVLKRESVEDGTCFAELVVASREWFHWTRDPVGNSLRAANMVLPPVNYAALAPTQVQILTNPVYTMPLNSIVTTPTYSPPPAAPVAPVVPTAQASTAPRGVNGTRKKKPAKSGNRRGSERGNGATASSPSTAQKPSVKQRTRDGKRKADNPRQSAPAPDPSTATMAATTLGWVPTATQRPSTVQPIHDSKDTKKAANHRPKGQRHQPDTTAGPSSTVTPKPIVKQQTGQASPAGREPDPRKRGDAKATPRNAAPANIPLKASTVKEASAASGSAPRGAITQAISANTGQGGLQTSHHASVSSALIAAIHNLVAPVTPAVQNNSGPQTSTSGMTNKQKNFEQRQKIRERKQQRKEQSATRVEETQQNTQK